MEHHTLFTEFEKKSLFVAEIFSVKVSMVFGKFQGKWGFNMEKIGKNVQIFKL